VNDELAAILQCPITKSPLSFVDRDELERLNAGIRSGQFQHGDGTEVKDMALEAALVSSDRKCVYPVVEGILVLLPSLAMARKTDAETMRRHALAPETESVMRFYDEIGWQEVDESLYDDARRWEDLRPVSAEYLRNCHLRLGRRLPKTGAYLLDAASGPLQYPEYLTYSAGYDYRICADISLAALRGAQKKLGDKGIYLQCDVTCLPLKDCSVDGFVSLHTIYHVPAAKQLSAFLELYRVLKRQGKGVVVYYWGTGSPLMKLFTIRTPVRRLVKGALKRILPPSMIEKLKERSGRAPAPDDLSAGAPDPEAPTAPEPEPAPYFHAYDRAWYRREVASRCEVKIACWRSVSVPFLKRCIRKRLLGRQLLAVLFRLESAFPALFGRFAEYPMLLFAKHAQQPSGSEPTTGGAPPGQEPPQQ